MADDAQDVQAGEISLESFMSDEQEAPKAESSTAEDKKPDAALEPKAEAETEAPTDKTDTAEADTGDETQEPQATAEDKPLNPKSENRFQQLANDNRQLRQQVEELTAQVYQAQTADELIEQINPETGEQYTRAEARVAALEQKLELKDYNEKVVSAQQTLDAESFRVLNEFPIYDPNSQEYKDDNGAAAAEAADLMEGYLIRDPNVPEIDPFTGQPTGKGIVIGATRSPYQLYKTLARTSADSVVKGQLKGQQDTEKMLANADTAGSAAPPKKASDPLMDLWKSDD